MISLELILKDWSDYDDKKCKEKNDCSIFSCEQKWEREYLKNKIIEQCPAIKGNDIIHTIRFCGLAMPAPRPRKIFISFVVKA